MPANSRVHTVKGVGCNSLISEIASSNPTDVMGVRLLCFVLFYLGSGLCDGLITGIEESYRFCVCFLELQKNEVTCDSVSSHNSHKTLAATCTVLPLLTARLFTLSTQN